MKKILLLCGPTSALLYLAMNIFIPPLWKEYSVVTQTVSELSAIGAPTRPVWYPWGIVYALLTIAFGAGVWQSATDNRPLRVVAGAFLADGAISLFWPPMNLRGVEMALTDVLHIAFAMVWLLTALVALGFGALTLGKRFRVYTLVTLGLFVMFGILTGMESPNIAKNLPTPRVGVWERINIVIYMLWLSVLGVALLRKSFSKKQA